MAAALARWAQERTKPAPRPRARARRSGFRTAPTAWHRCSSRARARCRCRAGRRDIHPPGRSSRARARVQACCAGRRDIHAASQLPRACEVQDAASRKTKGTGQPNAARPHSADPVRALPGRYQLRPAKLHRCRQRRFDFPLGQSPVDHAVDLDEKAGERADERTARSVWPLQDTQNIQPGSSPARWWQVERRIAGQLHPPPRPAAQVVRLPSAAMRCGIPAAAK